MSTQNSEKWSQTYISYNTNENETYTTNFDETNYQSPPTPHEIERLYGKGYTFVKQLGYTRKGCGKHEQGIHVPIEPNKKETKMGLGYSFSQTTKVTQ